MKKTSSRILAIALTVAVLASLIVGLLPVSAATPTGPTASASSLTISATANYTMTMDPTSALANPAAATSTTTPIAVTAGDTVTFVTGTTLTFTNPDPLVRVNSGVGTSSIQANGILTVAPGDVVKFSVTNTLATGAVTYYNQQAPQGTTFPVGLIVLKFSAGFPLPQMIPVASVAVSYDATLPLTLGGSTQIPVVHVAVNNTTNEVAIAMGPNLSGNAWDSNPGQRIFIVINGLTNPGNLGSYVISLKSSVDTTYADAPALAIVPAVVPGQISVYNAAGNFLGLGTAFGGFGVLDNQVNTTGGIINLADGYKLTLTPATYTLTGNWAVTSANVQIVPTTGSNADTIIVGNFTFGLNGTGDVINNIKFAAVGPPGTPAAALSLAGANDVASNIVTSGAITIAAGSTGATISKSSTTSTISVNGTGFNITNSTIDLSSSTSQKTGISLDNAAIAAGTISGNTFKVSQPTTAPANLSGDIAIQVNAAVSGVSITNNTFTGSVGGIGYSDAVGATSMKITKNTFTSLESAAVITAAGSTVTFSNNTVDKTITNVVAPSTNWRGALEISGGATVSVNSNVISNSSGYSIDIAGGATAVSATGNDFHANVKGVNNAGTLTLVAVQNWWGDPTGPKVSTNPAGLGDAITGTVTYTPFLSVVPTAGGAANVLAGATASPDFSATSGVAIVGYTAGPASIIGTERLSGNPKAGYNPPFPALTGGYFDVFTSNASTSTFQIKFYASGLTPSVQAYYWSTLSNSWKLCTDSGVSGTGDFVYVNVDNVAGASPAPADLTGSTSFVLVMGTAPTPAAFNIAAPTIGSNQPLTNISFTWGAVPNVTSYEFILANNSGFATPYIVDAKALVLPVYQYSGANLTAGTTYFWRVIAYQGSSAIGNSQIGYFNSAAATTGGGTNTVTSTISVTAPTVTTTVTPITVTSTIITIPPNVTTILPQQTIIITTNPPQIITFTNPTPIITTYTLPVLPVTQVTPAWIWGVIGIGAVLIIVVIVLIVRTRRSV